VTNHRATSMQWSGIERFVRYGAYDSCIIELRDRVEALEAAAKPVDELQSASAEARPGGLVKGVAKALHYAPHPIGNWNPEARAAILAVADWLYQQELHIAATRLRMEAQ
jgi:hypothetical protein